TRRVTRRVTRRGGFVTLFVLSGCHVVTMDGARSEHASGYVAVNGNRIAAVGAGEVPAAFDHAQIIDAVGCVATPGPINTPHHPHRGAPRGRAVAWALFQGLTELYPVWARIDEEVVRDAATAALAWLAKTGCTTTSDHHYVFPRWGGDVLGATV